MDLCGLQGFARLRDTWYEAAFWMRYWTDDYFGGMGCDFRYIGRGMRILAFIMRKMQLA